MFAKDCGLKPAACRQDGFRREPTSYCSGCTLTQAEDRGSRAPAVFAGGNMWQKTSRAAAGACAPRELRAGTPYQDAYHGRLADRRQAGRRRFAAFGALAGSAFAARQAPASQVQERIVATKFHEAGEKGMVKICTTRSYVSAGNAGTGSGVYSTSCVVKPKWSLEHVAARLHPSDSALGKISAIGIELGVLLVAVAAVYGVYRAVKGALGAVFGSREGPGLCT